METSPIGLDLIKEHEGFRATVYKDVDGNATVGYGHLVRPGEVFDRPLTVEAATAILQLDVQEAEDAVTDLVHVPLSQPQFDALVSFCYNVGRKDLANSTLLRLLNSNDYDAVPSQLLLWVNAGGKRVNGLVERREAEAQLWQS